MPKPNGAVIRSLRQQRGIKTGDFAERAGLAASTAYNIESADQLTSIEALYRVARVLDVPVADLIAEDDTTARSA